MRSALLAILTLLYFSSGSLFAAEFLACQQYFADGRPPTIASAPEDRLRDICFDGFAVLHSGKTHTPVFAAERINRAILVKDIKRTDRFYEEARLPSRDRARLSDYKGSGYDRGHMAPAADMGSKEAMAQSFSLSNMVPQEQVNNRKIWSSIENSVRNYVLRAKGDVYIISGPIYQEPVKKIGSSQVWVPKFLFKLVYDPNANKSWAYFIENASSAQSVRPITYHELVDRTGLHLMPALEDRNGNPQERATIE
ncbi:MAG: DNA/RNA non-specific endonuclease [Acidobacteriota bacterium]